MRANQLPTWLKINCRRGSNAGFLCSLLTRSQEQRMYRRGTFFNVARARQLVVERYSDNNDPQNPVQ
jgi:hypothetical protein